MYYEIRIKAEGCLLFILVIVTLCYKITMFQNIVGLQNWFQFMGSDFCASVVPFSTSMNSIVFEGSYPNGITSMTCPI